VTCPPALAGACVLVEEVDGALVQAARSTVPLTPARLVRNARREKER
jgi:hypothetical protein